MKKLLKENKRLKKTTSTKKTRREYSILLPSEFTRNITVPASSHSAVNADDSDSESQDSSQPDGDERDWSAEEEDNGFDTITSLVSVHYLLYIFSHTPPVSLTRNCSSTSESTTTSAKTFATS